MMFGGMEAAAAKALAEAKDAGFAGVMVHNIGHLPLAEGWKLYGKTGEVCKDAMTIGKHTFGSMDLAEMALFKGYDQIEICGVVTNICVIANAILLKTTQPEAEIIIDAKCVASNDEKLGNEALDVLKSMQFTVINR